MWECRDCGTRNYDYVSVCEVCSASREHPVLKVSTNHLVFRTLERFRDWSPSVIRITNVGTGVLRGEVKTSAPAYLAFSGPTGFALKENESIDVEVRLTEKAPEPADDQPYTFTNWIQVNSNAGGETVGGTYRLQPKTSGFWALWIIVTAVSSIISTSILMNINSLSLELMIFINSLIIGIGQWVLLKNKIYRSGWWIAATVLAWAMGTLLAVLLSADSIVWALCVGSLIGCAQALVLRWTSPQPYWKWALISIMAHFFSAMILSLFSIYDPIERALTSGFIIGVITGVPLERWYINGKKKGSAPP